VVVEGRGTTTSLGNRVPTAVCYIRDNTRDNTAVSNGWATTCREGVLQGVSCHLLSTREWPVIAQQTASLVALIQAEGLVEAEAAGEVAREATPPTNPQTLHSFRCPPQLLGTRNQDFSADHTLTETCTFVKLILLIPCKLYVCQQFFLYVCLHHISIPISIDLH